MPMTTRARALSRKSDTAIQKLDSNPPCVSASPQDDAHTSSAVAPAPPCKPRTKGNVVPTTLSVFPISVDQSAAPPLSPTMASSIHSSRAPKSGTGSKTSSSSTVRAQKLAAKVECARRLAHIDAEREKAQAEREKVQAEREKAQAERDAERKKALATLELQAELAAISCSSTQSSRTGYIENWLETSQNKTVSEHNNPGDSNFRERRPLRGSEDMPEQSESVMPASHNHALFNHTAPEAEVAITSAGLERHPRSEPRWERTAPAGHTENTAQTQLGTHHNNQNCNCHINKVSDITLLTQAIKSLKTPTGSKVSDLPIFTGSPTDWLYFHKMYERTRSHFDDVENLSRLSTALKGPAREAIASLLVASDDPKEVILALEQQFGNSELVVLKILAEVKALPRITNFDSSKELNVFACKIRNFVSTIQLLKYSEYLASPELVNTILGKLSPLLREKWVDFAYYHSGSNRFKLELLSEFLVHEASKHLKFGMFTENVAREKGRQEKSHYVAAKDVAKPSQSSSSDQSPHSSSNPHSIDSSSNNFGSTKNKSCLYCQCQTHDIESCHKFLSLSVEHRLKWATDGKLCRRCLVKGGHKYAACKKSCKVETCKFRRHHTLLHKDDANNYNIQTETESDTSGQASASTNTDSSSSGSDHEEHHTDTQDVTHVTDPPLGSFKPLLKIIAVTLKGPKGTVDTWALLDDGSTATFIDTKIAKKIGVTGSRSQVHLKCVGGLSKQSTVEFVDFSIKGVTSNSSHIVHRARSIPNLGISKQTLSHHALNFDHLKDLNNVLCFENAQPMVIIGVDNWHLTLPLEVRRGTKSQPVACRTLLGWVVFGFNTSRSVTVNFVEHDVLHLEEQESTNFDNILHVQQQVSADLDFLIKDYFKLDSLGISNIEYIGQDNTRAVKVLNDTTRRLDSGRFETGLIWRDNNLNPPNNYSVALSRYKLLERKFIKDPVYAQAYKANMQSVIDKGYAELCTEPSQGIKWYLPHFGVMHPQKRKLRVVHDAASVCQGVSLNSLLLSGPDLLQPLLAILMRFREGRIALNGDIKEMFPQTKIRIEDRDAQRFLWRSTPTEPIKEYRMSSMVFGATSSPFTALFLKNRNALENRNSFPSACDAIINDHYMDDYLGSVDSVAEAMQLAADIQEVHSRACLQMCSWVSNSNEALRLIPSEFRASSPQEIGLVNPLNQPSPSVRVLGVSWNVINDTLCFTRALPAPFQKLTKRAVLSKLMSVYDPLGLLAPVVIKGRILFQQIWRSGVGWDDLLPPPIASKWENWLSDLRETSNIAVPRCYTTQIDPVERQLHLFSDASEHAFSCVAYWRFTSQDGTIKLALIGGKARLAPLKPVSIPRLELQGALIAARLAKYICDAHKHRPTQTFFWCDSLTVLKWLRSDARSFKAFVAYRVGEIAELTDLRSWRYVPTAMNVADDATKPNSKFQISRWLSGPEFLLSNSEHWPREPPSSSTLQGLDEIKNNEFVAQISDSSSQSSLPAQSRIVTETRGPIVADYARFSKWIRLVRATARIRFCASKFINILRPINLPNSLTASNISTAERDLLLKSQSESFQKEIECLRRSLPFPKRSRLAQLALHLDSDGFIRLASRILAARDVLPNRDLQPIILDGHHPIVRLLLLHLHEKHAHGNCELVVNQMRLRYHVLHLRPSVKYVTHRCQTCKIRKATPIVPPFGDLPAGRLAHHKRPFSHVGVDYFGPINVTAGRRHVKRYVALFTCLTVRAVHLEIVENLTTDSALMALRRFIARRGCPVCIYSDNGTAFVGAARKLQEMDDFAANHNIQWKFITPAAPFMGGCWERLVRSVKTALSATLLERAPREEILHTLLMEAEAIVNSRPLTHVPVGPDDDEALTPYHFLIGGPSGDHQLQTLCDSDLCRRADYKKGLRLADHFWQRWTKEILPSLAARRAGSQKTISLGDLVLIVDGSLPRSSWPRGKVIKVYPGPDGRVRTVDIQTKAGTLKRPTRNLAILDSVCTSDN